MSEDTNNKKEETTSENKDIIDKDTLLYIGVGAGLLGLAGVLGIAGMGWMKEQDQQKRKMAMLEKQRQDMMLRQQQQMMNRQKQQDEGGWPNSIPRNTIPQSSAPPIMELPSETAGEENDSDFIGYQTPPPTAYNTEQQQGRKFRVSEDIMNTNHYPVINPNAPPEQIGNRISSVMSLDDNYHQQQRPQNQPYLIPTPNQQQNNRNNSSIGDDEDISDVLG